MAFIIISGGAVGETFLLVRIVAAAAVVGFLAFCIAHVVVVWRKRNAKPGGAVPVRSIGRRLAWGCLLAGVLLIPASAVLRELTRGDGTLTGEGLYILRAQDDSEVEWLREGNAVPAGELLARFGSGSRSARAHELQARVERADAELGVLELLPLSPDPELARRYQAAVQERSQAQQELGQAVIALEVAGRDLTAQVFNRKASLARLELTLTERRKEIDRVALKGSHARQQSTQYQSLAASGVVSASESQERIKASRDADIELSSLTQEMKDLQAEKEETRAHLEKLETERTNPSAPLRKQVATLSARVARLEADEAEQKGKIESDLARSTKLRGAEKVQAAAKVREHQAAVDSFNREREVLAPFAGRLAYRAASPNATRPRGTLLVLAPDDGFLLTARMAESDADAVKNGAEAMIELGVESPERRIPARFQKATPLPHEPGFAAVQFACSPPPEMVRQLVEGEKLSVAFTWRPPFRAMGSFRTGLFLIAIGFLGLILSGWRTLQRSKSPAESAPFYARSPEVAKARVGRLLAVRNAIDTDTSPETPAWAVVMDREPVEESSRTTEADGAVGLLERLGRISRFQGAGKPDPDQPQYSNRVLVSHEAETTLSGGWMQQRSGGA